MDEWAYDLAREIRKNRSEKVTGPCIGVVVNTKPFQILIQSGNFILDKDNTYICNQLLERKSKAKLKGSHTQNGLLNGGAYEASGEIEIEGDIELAEVWKNGDKVLVIPSGDGQRFFIVDIIREV